MIVDFCKSSIVHDYVYVPSLVRTLQKLFSEGEKMFLDGDEERAYVLYMRFLNFLTMVKKSPDYKKDAV